MITLTTDFGHDDWFVGVMKGVILQINPGAAIVDITHGIQPGNVRAAAFSLMASARYFPAGSIHVVVVDPGVGSTRRALVVQTDRGFFLGPDNGVLSWALRDSEIRGMHVLENERYFLSPVSQTFHGRDIFAPVAARLSNGVLIGEFGAALDSYQILEWREARKEGDLILGEIVHVDRFGNAISNVDVASIEIHMEVWAEDGFVCSVRDCYHAVRPGEAVAVRGSTGFLEIAINGGSAAADLHWRVGQRFQVRRSPPPSLPGSGNKSLRHENLVNT